MSDLDKLHADIGAAKNRAHEQGYWNDGARPVNKGISAAGTRDNPHNYAYDHPYTSDATDTGMYKDIPYMSGDVLNKGRGI